MSMNIVSALGSNSINSTRNTTKNASKPTWNGLKAYKYLEDMNSAALDYGAQATKYYSSQTSKDGEMSVDDLRKQINEIFPEYTLTSSEPQNVVNGKHYLYIDDSQLKKMAADSGYRAKVYGLMDREYTCGKEYTLIYSDGQNKTLHCTGTIFSLSEKNRKYAGADGVPYLGSCTTDGGFSSTQSHPQVRSQSFLYDNIDPAKSAKKSRTMATKSITEKLAKKRADNKKIEAKKVNKAEQKKIEEKREKRKAEEEELMEELFSEGSLFDAMA